MNEQHPLWAARARVCWTTLTSRCIRDSGDKVVVHEPGRRRPLAAWPLSQVLWASCLLAQLAEAPGRYSPTALWPALTRYRSGPGYLDNRPRGRRYYDDNAWLGLAAAQEALLTDGADPWWDRATELALYLARAQHSDGGVDWVEGGTTVNACSTGSVGLLMAVVADAQPSGAARSAWNDRAAAARDFLQGPLMRSDGLVGDHLTASRALEPTVWMYNQGLLLQLLARSPGSLTAARLFADRVEQQVAPQEMARQPAVFTSMWWRAKLVLAAQDPEVDVSGVEAFLSDAWERGRASGGFLSALSRYDDGVVLDHAAVTGLMAAYALGPGSWDRLL